MIKIKADKHRIEARLNLTARAKFKKSHVLKFSYDNLIENLLFCLKLRRYSRNLQFYSRRISREIPNDGSVC